MITIHPLALATDDLPVYRLTDGWDRFGELATAHPRIVIDIEGLAPELALRLLTTAVVRRDREFPGVSLHLCGAVPFEWLIACPVDSAEDRDWRRRFAVPERIAGLAFSECRLPAGRADARELAASAAAQHAEAIRRCLAALDLGRISEGSA